MTAQRRSDALRVGLRPPLRASERRCYTSPRGMIHMICWDRGSSVL